MRSTGKRVIYDGNIARSKANGRDGRLNGHGHRTEMHGHMIAHRDHLARAIELGGSSVSDYVDAAGVRGFFQLEHMVYSRAGEPCRCLAGAL